MPLILPNDIANEQDADGDLLQQNFATVEDWGNQEVITRDGSTGMTGALLLPGPPTQPNQAATKAYVDGQRMIGEFTGWAGKTEPPGWMFCRGQQVSRATYAALFAVIGTDYGAGDGSTTFHLPSFQGRFPIGVYPGGPWANVVGQTGGDADAHVISHAHTVNSHTHGVHINTGNESIDHNHGPGYGDDGFVTGTGSAPASFAPGASTNFTTRPATGGVSTPHIHGVNGNTDGSAPATDSQGVSATNANMPPFTAANFIIKVA